MTKLYAYLQGKQKEVGYHPEVPFLKQPKIIGSKMIKGVKHYLGVDGKKYETGLFDKTFKPNY